MRRSWSSLPTRWTAGRRIGAGGDGSVCLVLSKRSAASERSRSSFKRDNVKGSCRRGYFRVPLKMELAWTCRAQKQAKPGNV